MNFVPGSFFVQEFVRSVHPGLFFVLVFAGFCSLYFFLAGLVYWATRSFLPSIGVGRSLERGQAPGPASNQIRREIGRSSVSMLVFALYGLATLLGIRAGWLGLHTEPAWDRILLDAGLLILWNEIHFYVCHRLLHTRPLFRRVHFQHHRSISPTPFTAFSFHWLEAALLSSVMILVMPFYDFNVWALLFLPVWSLFWNVLGHAGYDLFPAAGSRGPGGAIRRHDRHHERPGGNFGFVFRFMDILGRTPVD